MPSIGNQLIEHYLEYSETRSQYCDLTEFERQKLGWDHAEAAAYVMHHWGFPDELVCCAYLHYQGVQLLLDPELDKTSVAAVAVASLMPDALRQSSSGLQQLMDLQKR